MKTGKPTSVLRSPYFEAQLIGENLRRSILAAAFLFLFALEFLLERKETGCAISGCFALIWMIVFCLIGRCCKREAFCIGWSCRIFWFLLPFAWMPLIYLGAAAGDRTYLLLAAFAVLAVLPIFSRLERLFLFLLELVTTMVAVVLAGGAFFDWRFFLFSILIGLLGWYLQENQWKLMIRLETAASVDHLTGLLSKQVGFDRGKMLLELCARHQNICAVYLIDIDYFKSYNDRFGHLAGDQALMSVSNCIKQCFTRETDVLLRMGGEEFVVCASVSSAADASHLAEELLNRVQMLHLPDGRDASGGHFLSVSVGIACYLPESGHTPEFLPLLDLADQQLYVAKRAGRHCVAMNGSVCICSQQEQHFAQADNIL